MQRVRGRSLGARRGPDTGTCSSPGVQDRASPTGRVYTLLLSRARAEPPGLMWVPSNLRASPKRPGPGRSPHRQAAQRGPAAGGQDCPNPAHAEEARGLLPRRERWGWGALPQPQLGAPSPEVEGDDLIDRTGSEGGQTHKERLSPAWPGWSQGWREAGRGLD